MRVLFLTHAFPRYIGDAPGAFLLRLAQALGREGVDVRVVAPAARGLAASEMIGGITVERFRYAPHQYETLAYTGTMVEDVESIVEVHAWRWSASSALISCPQCGDQRTFAPDVIHAHWWFPGGLVGTWGEWTHEGSARH